MAVLEPKADGFRNFLGNKPDRPAPETLMDRAHLLTLTAPELTALPHQETHPAWRGSTSTE